MELATKSGADVSLNSLTVASHELVKAPSTIVTSSAKQAYDLAFKITSRHGRIISVGVPHFPITVDSMHSTNL
jgi:D-arabinose 1-dehydrogenase-like Zn-dependent alcohol dehydrogenase